MQAVAPDLDVYGVQEVQVVPAVVGDLVVDHHVRHLAIAQAWELSSINYFVVFVKHNFCHL